MALPDQQRAPAPVDPGVDPLIGSVVVGKYRVRSLIARGGMGRIYQAEQLPLGRTVALKFLTPSGGDATAAKRFLLEAETYAKLTHPNTVTVFDYGTVDLAGEETCFIVLEYVPGRTLAQVLRAEGPMPPARVARVAREICRSLREAHALGIVHRDLKPSNVMLVQRDDGESVKVLDFGVAKAQQEGAEVLTSADSFVGTPRYTSPESIRQDPVDGRSDLYSLGVLMYEMLAGVPPFGPGEPLRVLYAHLHQTPPPFAERGVDVPPALDAVVRRCLEKEPAQRWPSAEALMGALRAADVGLDDTHTHKRATMPPPETSSPSLALPPAAPNGAMRVAVVGTVILGFLAAVAVVIGGFLWLVREDAPPPPVAEAPPPFVTTGAEAEPAVPIATVTVLSSPPGADVYEGAARLGETPLELPAPQAPRALTLKRRGYQSVEVIVRPGEPPAPVALQAVRATAAPKPPAKPDPDIRLER